MQTWPTTLNTSVTGKFSPWVAWDERDSLVAAQYPGIYCIALSNEPLVGTPFSMKPVIYIGMSNARSGLKGRLQQFDNTLQGRQGHGGALRVRYKYHNYAELVRKMYVSIVPFQCNPECPDPIDYLMMGDVARAEYVCLAIYKYEFGDVPEFNRRTSPKDATV